VQEQIDFKSVWSLLQWLDGRDAEALKYLLLLLIKKNTEITLLRAIEWKIHIALRLPAKRFFESEAVSTS